MKTLLLALVAMISITALTHAQTANGFGIKGGINYGANGDYFDSAANSYEHPDRNIGYHFGIFGKVGNRIFFRPELVYTSTKSDYRDDSFSMQKLDAPLLLGAKIIGPLNVFAGPSLQYILDSEFDDITLGEIEEDFSVGINFGIGLHLKRFGIDLRYERGFSDNEADFLNNNDRLDTRPDQLILSLFLLL
ncbi:outer membrane beta-barrel protein [Neotamlana laminarinivorans]|uniref:PorT family protein n=1 Tax=Neotamlana laminarinivorans TaxID=2883124 RepID=A0A9X1I079_9FLAO|nr:outer membrane beta-barrel protein [Tamlana laminarinivorans]MCB4799021.1 PorT family protein [Tamlana laminarinivorans]